MFNKTRIACPPKSQRRRKYRESNYLCAYKAPLQLSRDLYKSNPFLQNKANSPSVQDDITAYSKRAYKNYVLKSTPKNKAKQSQFKANFSPKLGSFFTKLALNQNKFVAFWHRLRGKFGRVERNVQARLQRTIRQEQKVVEDNLPKSINPVILSNILCVLVSWWLKISVESVPSVAKYKLVKPLQKKKSHEIRDKYL